ncbi:MAG: hypothetical protein ACR2OB_05270 [Solirubrobacteraceae bacterium]
MRTRRATIAVVVGVGAACSTAAPVRRRALVLLLLAACALLLAAAPALAARSDAKAMWGPVSVNGASEFPVYQKLGVGIFEMSLSWRTIAPTRPRNPRNPNDPAYHWPADIGYALAQAAHYHMRVLLLAIGTPPWANGGRPFNWAPDRAGQFADFLTAAARRYRAVHLWMVWGEPSRGPNFEPLTPVPPGQRTLSATQATAPHRYAQLLDASYAALKHQSARNLVIGGNTYTTGDISTRQWIENLRLPGGRRPRMDLYGHNPFSFRAPNLANPPSPNGEVDFSDLARLSRLVNRTLAPPHHSIKLFLSEWTIPTGPDSEFNFHATRAVQAQWITDAWRIVRHSSFIYALGWIHLFDDAPGGSMGGLLDHQGNPKPGFFAFKAG